MGVFKYGVLAVTLLACGTEKINQCEKDSDCEDIAYPFCDVDGQYSPSGGEHNVCTVTPSDCPVERCGCSPGAMSCAGDQLGVCNQDGSSQSMTTCPLGCKATKDKCQTFVPMNGLGAALNAAGDEEDVTFPALVKINTSTGTIRDGANLDVAVKSLVVSQQNGPEIFVVYAKSFQMMDVAVSGSRAIAFVAPGSITMRGVLSAGSYAGIEGPGSIDVGECVGTFAFGEGGGGGNGTAGGRGESFTGLSNGGVRQSTFSPLAGGCHGGGARGGGGGAVQLDSLSQISLSVGAIIDVGGGGGGADNGAGAGGTVVVEAPVVQLSGNVFANGGSGGACGMAGKDADLSTTAVTGPSCVDVRTTVQGGAGGTATTAAGGGNHSQNYGASGGGSVGRMLVVTQSGDFSQDTSAVLSVGISKATLVIN